MRLRTFATLAAAAALAGGCSFHFMGDGGLSFGDLERATRTESRTLDLTSGETLLIDGLAGDVRVHVDPSALPHVDSSWTCYARTKSDAQAILDGSALIVEKSGDAGAATLHLSVKAGEPPPSTGVVYSVAAPYVDLTVTIPEKVKLIVKTRYGDVAVDGPTRFVYVEAPHGDVRVVDAEGANVTSSSGKLTLEKIRGPVDANTEYDSIEIADVEATTVRARSNSGAIRLRNARARRVELATSFDDIVLDHVTALGGARSGEDAAATLDVSATTSSGAIRVDHGGDANWGLATSYGDVVARDLSGTLEARTRSGAIHVDGFRGEVRAQTDFDDVVIDGELHGVEARSNSGKIHVVARPGSRVATPWRLMTNYDDVLLDLPADFNAELDATTSYGTITGDFEVKASPNDENSRAFVRLGSGGGLIRVATANGNVKVVRR